MVVFYFLNVGFFFKACWFESLSTRTYGLFENFEKLEEVNEDYEFTDYSSKSWIIGFFKGMSGLGRVRFCRIGILEWDVWFFYRDLEDWLEDDILDELIETFFCIFFKIFLFFGFGGIKCEFPLLLSTWFFFSLLLELLNIFEALLPDEFDFLLTGAENSEICSSISTFLLG